jgi:hypothetical protein
VWLPAAGSHCLGELYGDFHMPDGTPTITHLGALRAARKEGQSMSAWAREGSVERRFEQDAVYFSRRAREELHAAIEANTRKARRSHLDLAEAYEIRAHVMTHRMTGPGEDRLW